MRLATWNVNSLNARLDRVVDWLERLRPDVVCLQETKLADDAFPVDAFSALGYEAAHHGQGRWNGVAIVSRVGLDDVHGGFADDDTPDPDARLIRATCGNVRVASCYVPNGRELDHEQYWYKLAWLARLHDDLVVNEDPSRPLAVVGDFNIAPDDRDVWDPAVLEDATHASPAERATLATLCSWGLRDVFHDHHEADGVFSWWDYRDGNFHKRKGMRIDLVLTTGSLAERVQRVFIDRSARKGKQPSDHAPVVLDSTE